MKAGDKWFPKASKEAQDASELRLNQWLIPLTKLQTRFDREIASGNEKAIELRAKTDSLFEDNLKLLSGMKEMYERIRAFEDELKDTGISKVTN